MVKSGWVDWGRSIQGDQQVLSGGNTGNLCLGNWEARGYTRKGVRSQKETDRARE